MPELPEVETTRRGIRPVLKGRRIEAVIVRQRALRWPVPSRLNALAARQVIHDVQRRGKYLLLQLAQGTILIHLGMSGHLRVLKQTETPGKHDHVDILVEGSRLLRLTDPRRFGAVLWIKGNPAEHPLLAHLGPEPLERSFNGASLYAGSRGRRVAIKAFIMDSRQVAGVGNIYANEALFQAGIRPSRPAGRLKLEECEALAGAIKQVLAKAVRAGGTTLRDFRSAKGKRGYFQQQLSVYGRGRMPCVLCGEPLKETRQGQRSTVYCSACQA